MRVTHVITRLIVGGAQENTIGSVVGLRRKYHVDVHLISGPTTGPEGSLEQTVAAVPGLLSIVPSLVRPLHPWSDGKAYRELIRRFRERPCDIVHTHSGKAGILGRLAAHRAGVPVIVHTIHGPSFGPFQGKLANALFLTAERVAGKMTTHFISVANAMTQQYLAAGIGTPHQYTRIFSGFDLRPFQSTHNNALLRQQYGLGPDDFVIGAVARLFKLKGHDDLFAAAPEIVTRLPRAKFLLVGDGPWRSRFEAMAQQRGLEGRFVFTGLVPPSEIPALIGMMDILVHLSLREGLPRALPQALAAGKPIVAYDIDGAREVCLDRKTGFLVHPGDLAVLTGRIQELGLNPALREQLGRHGRSLVRETFGIERMVEELYSLYRRLLSNRTG